jgi:hypothetical protein
MDQAILNNPAMVRKIAANAAKTLVQLHYGVGVVGIDHAADIPQVQMENLATLRYITGGVKLRMEKKGSYTRYSAIVDGVDFYFLSLKKHEEQEAIEQ